MLFNKYNFTIGELNGIVVLIGGTIFSIKSIYGVLASISSDKRLTALKDTLIYFFFFSTLLSVGFLTDSVIAKEYPKILILTFGFQFAKMLGILQLSHILGSPYKVYKPVFLIPLLALLIHSLTFYFTGYSLLVSIDALIIAVFVWNVISWMHYVYFCSDEICEILNINRFVLGKRYPSRKSYEEIKKL